METQHKCFPVSGTRAPVTQCDCGQWWKQGIAIAGFVAKRILAETPAPDPVMKPITNLEDGDDKYTKILRYWGEGYKVQHPHRNTSMRFAYWEYDHKGMGLCRKSYLAFGTGSNAFPDTVSYGTGSMIKLKHSGLYVFQTHSLKSNSVSWDRLNQRRKDHQYKLIAEVLV